MTAYVAMILVLMVLGLRLLGRRWWCACGRWWPCVPGVSTPHTSQHVVDVWSLTHLTHGVVLWLLLSLFVPSAWMFVGVLAAEAGWEILENTQWAIDRYRVATVSQGYTGDSIANSLGDVACCMLGAWWAWTVDWHVAVGGVAVLETILAVEIRDNLTLNVLMLVWPIEAIKRWQAAR